MKKNKLKYEILFSKGSIYFTLATTVERYTTVCHPFFKVYKQGILVTYKTFQWGHLKFSM